MLQASISCLRSASGLRLAEKMTPTCPLLVANLSFLPEFSPWLTSGFLERCTEPDDDKTSKEGTYILMIATCTRWDWFGPFSRSFLPSSLLGSLGRFLVRLRAAKTERTRTGDGDTKKRRAWLKLSDNLISTILNILVHPFYPTTFDGTTWGAYFLLSLRLCGAYLWKRRIEQERLVRGIKS